MSQLDQIREPVKKELQHFEEHFKKTVKSNISLLNIVMNYVLRTKGKQIRPLMVFLISRLHGTIGESSYTAAALIELLHTATLIHDDVVDESYERRGFFSINALWKSKVAVLIGDYLLAKGMSLSVENGEFDLLKIVSKAVREMIEGELLQIQKSRKLNLTESDYYDIIRKKTATLIAACSACGAKAAGADDTIVEKMWCFGEQVGIAFQIKDDLLDYDHNGITGKPSGNDIKEKKLTLPLIYTLSNSNQSVNNKILKIINKDNKNPKKVQDVIEFVIEKGGIEYAQKKMIEYKDQALLLLNDYPDSQILESVKLLLEFIVTRKK